LKGEEKFCVRFADQLRQASREGRLKAVWFHVPNEGKRGALTMLVAKAMGLIPGVTDYIFLGEANNACMEIKFGANETSPSQTNFRKWCIALNVPIITLRAHSEADIDNKIYKAFEFLKSVNLYE
jgi:hypothetical protein